MSSYSFFQNLKSYYLSIYLLIYQSFFSNEFILFKFYCPFEWGF